jgi:DNA-binding NarL/FixJ family response regulator
MYDTTQFIFRALRAGARGYVLKESASIEVINAIRAVHAGQSYLSQKILGMAPLYHLQQWEVNEVKSPLERLSHREREVLQLIVEGKSSAEIAAILLLSVHTVDTYRGRIMQKLGISNIPSLVKFAIQHGLTSLE